MQGVVFPKSKSAQINNNNNTFVNDFIGTYSSVIRLSENVYWKSRERQITHTHAHIKSLTRKTVKWKCFGTRSQHGKKLKVIRAKPIIAL